MIKAIVKNGVVVPRDPLPADWQDGTEVEVDKPAEPSNLPDEIDHWLAELNAIAAGGNPEDDRRLQVAIESHQREQKELARKRAESQ